jgi:hypothetical protein
MIEAKSEKLIILIKPNYGTYLRMKLKEKNPSCH